MSRNGSSFTDWLLDLIAYQGANTKEMPPLESSDGQEPTAEPLRAAAREIDAKPPVETKNAPAVDKRKLDKEFWETL